MAENCCRVAYPTDSAADHVTRGNPDSTARDLVARLGQDALGRAIDHEVKARTDGDSPAVAFWGRVCSAVIRLRLACADG